MRAYRSETLYCVAFIHIYAALFGLGNKCHTQPHYCRAFRNLSSTTIALRVRDACVYMNFDAVEYIHQKIAFIVDIYKKKKYALKALIKMAIIEFVFVFFFKSGSKDQNFNCLQFFN